MKPEPQGFFYTFGMAAPALWNILPYHIRSCSSLNIFKQSIKTFLFRQAFE
jgi:hypothetical protein